MENRVTYIVNHSRAVVRHFILYFKMQTSSGTIEFRGKGLSKNKHTSENAVARSRSWAPAALQ